MIVSRVVKYYQNNIDVTSMIERGESLPSSEHYFPVERVEIIEEDHNDVFERRWAQAKPLECNNHETLYR